MLTIEKVKKLERYLESSESEPDRLIGSAIDKLLNREQARLMDTKDQLVSRMRGFEQQYVLDSAAFYRLFNAGELGDEMDFFEWDAVIDMVEQIDQKLSLLL